MDHFDNKTPIERKNDMDKLERVNGLLGDAPTNSPESQENQTQTEIEEPFVNGLIDASKSKADQVIQINYNRFEEKTVYLDPELLKPHPRSLENYGTEDVDLKQVEYIRVNTHLEPLIVNLMRLIPSGYCLLHAIDEFDRLLKELAERKIEEGEVVDVKLAMAYCLPIKYDDDVSTLEAITESNWIREKTFLQKCKELHKLQETFAIKAEERKRKI
jgi:hypothetical protein